MLGTRLKVVVHKQYKGYGGGVQKFCTSTVGYMKNINILAIDEGSIKKLKFPCGIVILFPSFHSI